VWTANPTTEEVHRFHKNGDTFLKAGLICRWFRKGRDRTPVNACRQMAHDGDYITLISNLFITML